MCETRSPKLFSGPGCTGAEFPNHDVAHVGHRYHQLPKGFVVRSVSLPPGIWSPQLDEFYARGEMSLDTVDHVEFRRRPGAPAVARITDSVSPAIWISFAAVLLLVVILFLALS